MAKDDQDPGTIDMYMDVVGTSPAERKKRRAHPPINMTTLRAIMDCEDPRLTRGRKLVYIYLAANAEVWSADDNIWLAAVGHKSIAKFVGVTTERAISNHIAALRDAGLMEVQRIGTKTGGSRNWYFLKLGELNYDTVDHPTG